MQADFRATRAPRPSGANGRVTVVIPTYNRAALLPRALASVFAQTRADLCDVVVVDDGSTDDTPCVIAPFLDRIRYLRQPNRGGAAARNAGVRASGNEFVAFLDSDDCWDADKTQQQVALLRAWPEAGFVAGRTMGARPDGSEVRPDWPAVALDRPVDLAPHLLKRNFLHTPAVMVRRSLLARTGLFRPCLRRAHDFDLWMRLACAAPGILQDRAVARVTLGAGDGLSHAAEQQIVCTVRALRLLRAERGARPDCRAVWRAALGHYLRLLRDRAYREGRFGSALKWGLLSLAHNPRGRARWEWGRCAETVRRLALGDATARSAEAAS